MHAGQHTRCKNGKEGLPALHLRVGKRSERRAMAGRSTKEIIMRRNKCYRAWGTKTKMAKDVFRNVLQSCRSAGSSKLKMQQSKEKRGGKAF